MGGHPVVTVAVSVVFFVAIVPLTQHVVETPSRNRAAREYAEALAAGDAVGSPPRSLGPAAYAEVFTRLAGRAESTARGIAAPDAAAADDNAADFVSRRRGSALPVDKGAPRPEEIDALFAGPEAKLWAELKAAKCSLDWGPAVRHELSNWAGKGFTLKQVQQYCVKAVFRLSFVKGEMRVARYGVDRKNVHRLICGHWLIFMAAMRAAARGDPLPPFEINIQPGDAAFGTGRMQWLDAAPLLSNVKCGGASVSFPLTIHDQFGHGHGHMSLEMYQERYNTALGFETPLPAWPKKKPGAFFSAPAGAKLRGNRSLLFDIRSKHVVATDKTTHVSDMAGYQGNIYAYGHCGWSRRVHELAMMKTVVYMEDSTCREYFHALFEPGVDHVAVAEDFSDLADKAAAVAADPRRGEAMVNRWYAKGTAVMSLPCVLDYVEAVLREYAALQRFTPEHHPSWPRYLPNLTDPHAFFRSDDAALPPETCDPPQVFKAKKAHKC